MQTHAGASPCASTVTRPAAGTTRLVVGDDGRGFGRRRASAAREEGHVGLTLLEGLVAQAGGRLDVRSAPGDGDDGRAGGPAAMIRVSWPTTTASSATGSGG